MKTTNERLIIQMDEEFLKRGLIWLQNTNYQNALPPNAIIMSTNDGSPTYVGRGKVKKPTLHLSIGKVILDNDNQYKCFISSNGVNVLDNYEILCSLYPQESTQDNPHPQLVWIKSGQQGNFVRASRLDNGTYIYIAKGVINDRFVIGKAMMIENSYVGYFVDSNVEAVVDDVDVLGFSNWNVKYTEQTDPIDNYCSEKNLIWVPSQDDKTLPNNAIPLAVYIDGTKIYIGRAFIELPYPRYVIGKIVLFAEKYHFVVVDNGIFELSDYKVLCSKVPFDEICNNTDITHPSLIFIKATNVPFSNCVKASYKKNELVYIARGYVKNHYSIGEAFMRDGEFIARIPWNGREHILHDFEVLCITQR